MGLLCTLYIVHLYYLISATVVKYGGTLKNRIQPLHILQKRAIRMCGQLEYIAHSKPAFFKFNALTIFDTN